MIRDRTLLMSLETRHPQHGPIPSPDKGPHTFPEGAATYLVKGKSWVVFNMLTACTEQQCNVIIHPANCQLFYFYHATFPPQPLLEVRPWTLFAPTDATLMNWFRLDYIITRTRENWKSENHGGLQAAGQVSESQMTETGLRQPGPIPSDQAERAH